MSRTAASPWTGVAYACDDADHTPDLVADALAAAQDVLFGLSGGRVGTFKTIGDRYRLPRSRAGCGAPYKTSEGRWRNGGVQNADCCLIELDRQPVTALVAARVDGVTLDPDTYTLIGNTIQRLGECWPMESDCDEPIIEIDYEWGVPPGPVARLAAGELVCEILAATTPGAVCNLPSSWTDISRQGVSIRRPDIASLVSQGLTGMPLTDQFIRLYNPNRLRQRSRVVKVDGASRAGR